ncbi:tRNA (adenosine(37)-N6)-threonylcarbamoyltransferase complex ATPase subunit type 1 TsaE [bacterium (Candidatus Gribaldobacteria) CG07_land_8_20_14_0_80_33_18]|uniref:tRNA threonylcarbamoyladenosine biosynthesis protein TsaE n=1 Tax=bacterium (Candidatus Gribaldobacteria) CG07_land_8_20_14_0_80_33_18 TaxID=2014272 RepID=A0A2M6Z1V9_9BACT|nr:MAG: tRNA (adenosine(37)-N6)-threonylcarbamoyltransferase complex ATPase subunit type 1 TsaE [bacterium (Candidatus Gribaldobacteria) CG10_big_fil_rev_8_21_14_0_10_33_41]PIU46398.1 MAG: tRNA (adenosine(37)-N6)-threonylcarbamoyltransferase complex ATPase subunit type 1 TsaE [bacterium (Candidatus Gribaldobacteria) CG07_land_8_20_14_0_80_33_18]PJA01015.1 MAG: tRNA (adenosine(37)-N6)-threonylcarbamoyltransferase complex ATPase subunit type 1 TsaE [bacterium (Candidatus Gribaldobacteria) CG_4_10_1
MNYITFNSIQTKKMGRKIAQEILKRPLDKKAIVIGLIGDLGGGKTTFLQGFAKGLRIKNKILSPTFVLMKKFKIRENSHSNSYKFATFYHLDCYRIKKPKEILGIGFEEIIKNPHNIVVIEWADRIKKILPKESLIIRFKFINQNTRKILFNP